MSFNVWAVLSTAFGLGLLHAFDADHVMAVSALGTRKPGVRRLLRFGVHWAVGHGGVLILAGLLLFGVGYRLPSALVQGAEASVGVLLIVIGLACFWRIRHQRLRLVSHRHGDLVHTHLQPESEPHGDDSEPSPERRTDRHAPVLVGMLHGLAGSAPALALVPVVTQGQFGVAATYLLVFSLGVLLAMTVFGMGFGHVQTWLQRQSLRWFQLSRYLVASGSVVLGGVWLSQSV